MWKVTASKELFAKIKTQESFWSLVALARVINSFRFVHTAYEAHQGGDSPASQRCRLNSFFFNCGILAEAILLVQGLHKHLKDVPEFQRLAEVVKGKEVKALLGDNVAALRNKLVFHFDLAEIGSHLASMSFENSTFATGLGDTRREEYYVLADLCALTAFSRNLSDDKMKYLIGLTADISGKFIDAAEELIMTQLRNSGWKIEVNSENSETG